MYYNTKIQTFSPTKYTLNTFELGELELTGMDAQGHTVFLSRPFFPQRPSLYLCMHPPCFYRYTLPSLPVWILWKQRGQADSGKCPNLNSCHVLLLQHIWIGGGKRLKCVGSKKTGRFLALFPTSVIGSTQMVKWEN